MDVDGICKWVHVPLPHLTLASRKVCVCVRACVCVCMYVCLGLQLMFLFSVMLHCKPKSKAHRAYAHLLNENRSMALPSWPGTAARHGGTATRHSTADSSNLQLNANCIVVELLYNWCNVHRARAAARARAGAGVRAGAMDEGDVRDWRLGDSVCVNKLK